jgi:hypothetical protein
MDRVALLNRTDTKFLLNTTQLSAALSELSDVYRILEIDANRLNQYQTVYFDTPDYALYRRHHDGALNRYKVRSREYVDTQLAFLEVKHKTNKRRTIKSRMQTTDVVTQFDKKSRRFVRAHYPADPRDLEPKLNNGFTRITLVSCLREERLTLDFGLRFATDEAHADLDGLVIAEVKQSGFSMQSDFIKQMRALGVRRSGFSKYCVGVALLNDGIKANNFKPKLLHIDKLLSGGTHGTFH